MHVAVHHEKLILDNDDQSNDSFLNFRPLSKFHSAMNSPYTSRERKQLKHSIKLEKEQH